MRSLPGGVYRVFQTAARDALAGSPDLTRCHVLAAVSGGLDSMVLLTFLVWLRQFVTFPLTVAHLDHGLRADAARDAKLVRAYAARFDLPFCLRKEDVSARAAAEKQGIEAAGRAARYRFFADLGAEFDRPCLIALAHHRQDQAETVLLNITRGAGLPGLTGMAGLDGDRWRPFLRVSRQDLEMAAASLGIPYADDASNQSDVFLRNRLRHQLLPAWSGLAGHDMVDKLAGLADRLRAEDDALNEMAGRALKNSRLRQGEYQVSAVKAYPEAVIRRMLEKGYRESSGGCMLQAAHTDMLLRLLGGSRPGKVNLPAAVTAVFSHGVLRFVTDRPHE